MPESMMQPDLQGVATRNSVQAAAMARWQERGWPGANDEAWRFTRLASLDKLSLRPADGSMANGAGDFPTHTLPAGAHAVHFHNGILVADSIDNMPKGISARLVDEGDLGSIIDLAPANHPVTDMTVRSDD